MRDPIDRLTSLEVKESLPVLPAAEIRRRGDARRRRRAAGLGVAAAAALVAAVAIPSALADRTLPVDPATSGPTSDGPTTDDASWRTTIPAGTTLEPVVDGFEDRFTWTTSDDATGVGTIELCGAPAFPLDGVLDRLAADSNPLDDSADAAGRELRLYADDAAAEAALQQVRDAVDECPEETHDGVAWLHHEPMLREYPGESVLGVTRTYEVDGETAPGVVLWQLIRVGNALVGLVIHSEHGDVDTGLDLSGDTPPLIAIVESMCVFAVDGCDEPPPEPTDPETPTTEPYVGEGANIPGDFPLTTYLPTGEEYELVDALEGGAGVELCGETIWPPDYHQSFGLMAVGPEHVEVRWLAAFGDAAQATKVIHTTRAALVECTTSGGYTVTALDDDEDDGGPLDVTFALTDPEGRPDGAVYQLVQVGSAVLFSSSGGELTLDTAQGVADELSAQSTDLATEMCVFTNEGC